jgi:DNA repair exonuclease SbcCD ATPase subunit
LDGAYQWLKNDYKRLNELDGKTLDLNEKFEQLNKAVQGLAEKVDTQNRLSLLGGSGDSYFSTDSPSSTYSDVSTAKPQPVINTMAPLKIDAQSTCISCRAELFRNKHEFAEILGGEIGKLTADINGFQEQLNKLNKSLDSLKIDKGQRKAKGGEFSNRLGLLEGEFKRFGKVMNDRFSELGNKINELPKEKDTLDYVNLKLAVSQSDSQKAISKKYEDKFSEFWVEIDKLTERIKKLEKSQEFNQELEEKNKFKTLPQRVRRLEDKGETHEGRIAKIEIQTKQIERQQSQSVISQVLSYFCIWRSAAENKKMKPKSQ